MAKIIFTNGAEFEVAPQNGTDFSLHELQGVVGGYIEVVHLSGDDIMIVNEEGRLAGLSHNVKASVIARDYIVGNVLLCSRDMVR